jgi:hypothetical protein
MKVLGSGSHGVVGLWERINDEGISSPKYVCVKQAGAHVTFRNPIDALKTERRLYISWDDAARSIL